MPYAYLGIGSNVDLNQWSMTGSYADTCSGSDGLYRQDGGFGNWGRAEFANLPAVAVAVQQVKAYWRRGSPSGVAQGGFNIYLTSVGPGTPTTVYSAQSGTCSGQGYSGALACPSGSWSVAKVNETRCHFDADKPSEVGGDVFEVRYASLEVLYTLPGGGFMYLIPPFLIGASLLIGDMPGIARETRRLTGHLIAPSEYEAAFRDLRGTRRTVFDIGGRKVGRV